MKYSKTEEEIKRKLYETGYVDEDLFFIKTLADCINFFQKNQLEEQSNNISNYLN